MKLRIGGVPEHFNYLWQLPETREFFRNAGFYYEWSDYPGGTGAMTEALLKKETDVAIMLTEGAIAAVAQGHPFAIRTPFVMSPLQWGVFGKNGRVKPWPDNFHTAVFAISRYNSGSHLMAQFLAQREGLQLSRDNFLVTQNLQGAREALGREEADYFLWEKFMTRPLLHSGEFMQCDEIAAPWPAFVFVTRKYEELPDWEAFAQACAQSIQNFITWPAQDLVYKLADAYHIAPDDVKDWLQEVKYYDGNHYWSDRLTAAVLIMHSKGMIERMPSVAEMIGN
ncbi:MAG: ABC transporter substrate-binding protein [Bacteroidetes bacterium]|nr:ABC transporter substrate-binding protein [Bacteroidota bacterium]